jgi:hypothetical protein
MGRIQQIDQNICLVHELQQMQADIAAMQARMGAQSDGSTPPADGTTPPPSDGTATPPADGSGGAAPTPAPAP